MSGPVKKFSAGSVSAALWENEANVDGRKVMCNEREARRWVDSGVFYRIPAGDGEDEDYRAMKKRMFDNGDQAYYEAVIPSARSAGCMWGGKSDD